MEDKQTIRLGLETKWLVIGTRVTAILVVVVSLIFATYYILDRYVHFGEKSPLELTLNHLEQKIRENPSDIELRITLAASYLETGRTKEAYDQINQVLQIDPNNQDCLYLLGISYTENGYYDQAIHYLGKFIELRQSSPMANMDMHLESSLYFLGMSYMATNQPEKAIEAFEDALKILDSDADAIFQLGNAYQQTGNHQEAIKNYYNALRFVPNFLEVYIELENIYRNTNQPEYLLFSKGGQAFCRGDYQGANKNLTEAVEELPGFAPAFILLGLTKEYLGDLPQAKQNLEIALSLEPESLLAKHSLGRILSALGESPQKEILE